MKRIFKDEIVRLVIISIVGLLGIIFTFSNYFINISDYLIQNEQQQLLTISSTVADSIERFFLNYERSFKVMTNNYLVNEYVKSKDGAPLTYVEDYYEVNKDEIYDIAVTDEDFNIVYSVKEISNFDVGRINQNIEKVRLGKQIEYSSLYKDNKDLYIDMYVPHIVNGQVEFVIISRFSLKTIYENLVETIKVGEKGYASLKDNNGVLIMHPKYEDIGTDVIVARKSEFPEYDWSELEALVEKQKQGQSGVGIYHSIWYHDSEKKNIKKISAYAPANIGNDFWIVNVSMDYLEMTDFVRKSGLKSGLIIFMLVLLYIILIVYIYSINRKKVKLELEVGYSRQINELNKELEEDLEVRKNLQEKLQKNIEKYKKLFNGASDCIFVYMIMDEGQYKCVDVNDRALLTLKYSELEFMKMDFNELSRENDNSFIKGIVEDIKNGYRRSYEKTIYSSEKDEIYVEINGHIIVVDDKESIVLLSRDITNRKLQEQSLFRSQNRFRNLINTLAKEVNLEPIKSQTLLEDKSKFNSQLEHINLELEKMFKDEVEDNKRKEAMIIYQSRLAAMGEMIGNIAHQWRQPLSTLSMIITNIGEEYISGEMTEEFLKLKIEKSIMMIEHMSKTIDDFRYFFNPKDEEKEFHIVEMLGYVYNFLSDHMRLNNISFYCEEKVDDLSVFGYPNHFAQVLFVIIQNACDAIISRNIPEGLIECEIDFIENRNIVKVRDNGMGVSEDNFNKLFTQHFTTKSLDKGSGIGLYMCKEVIEKSFNGQIYAENLDKGLQIIIELPIGGDNFESNQKV